jgi:hypothetical protein
MKKYSLPLVLFILFFSLPLSAQEGSVATIEYASGDDVLVIRAGRRLNFSDPFGLELLEGDQVQTGRGVFVELRLRTGGAVVKLAENTTFKLERMVSGETSLSLVYGRVRAKVDKLAGTDTFTIRSATSVAGVRGTDFGIDVIARQQAAAPESLTRTYVFEGTVTVTALLRSSPLAAEGLEPIPREFTLEAGEMVVVSRVDTATEAEKTTIETSILEFWSENDFSTIDVPGLLDLPAVQDSAKAEVDTPVHEDPAIPSVSSDLSAEALKEAFDRGYSSGYPAGYQAALAVVPEPAPQQEFVLPEGLLDVNESQRIKQALALQKSGVIAGSLLVSAAAGLAGSAIWQMESGNTVGSMDNFRLAAIVSLSSLPFFLAALAVNP